MKTLKDFSYNEKNNIIDITLEPITEESKAYIVDQKLINYLLKEFSSVPFSLLQETVKQVVDNSKDFQDLATNVENFMYLHKVANHPELKKPEVKEQVTNEFRKDRMYSEEDEIPQAKKVGRIPLPYSGSYEGDNTHSAYNRHLSPEDEETLRNESELNGLENQSHE